MKRGTEKFQRLLDGLQAINLLVQDAASEACLPPPLGPTNSVRARAIDETGQFARLMHDRLDSALRVERDANALALSARRRR